LIASQTLLNQDLYQAIIHWVITIRLSTIIPNTNIKENDTILLKVYHIHFKYQNVIPYEAKNANNITIEDLNPNTTSIITNTKRAVSKKLSTNVPYILSVASFIEEVSTIEYLGFDFLNSFNFSLTSFVIFSISSHGTFLTCIDNVFTDHWSVTKNDLFLL